MSDIHKNIIQNKKIKRIYYFHVDHFEPASLDGTMLADRRVINYFFKEMRRHNFSKRASLFFRVPIEVEFGNIRNARNQFGLDKDKVFFTYGNAAKQCDDILGMASNFLHELQIHVHHEHFTENATGPEDYYLRLHKYLNSDRNNSSMDSRRLKLYIKLCIEFLKKSDKFNPDEWFFVHGKWALNGSDYRVCKVEDEIKILNSLKCAGDFSFPAGRRKCNPATEAPFVCTPYSINRCYDYLLSNPQEISFNGHNMSSNRFFIWNSKIKHIDCSLDFYSTVINQRLMKTDIVLKHWLEDSVLINGNLFIKTHAHSLMPYYFDNPNSKPVFPLTNPSVIDIFKKLETICTDSNTDLQYINASKAFRLIRKLDKGEVI